MESNTKKRAKQLGKTALLAPAGNKFYYNYPTNLPLKNGVACSQFPTTDVYLSPNDPSVFLIK